MEIEKVICAGFGGQGVMSMGRLLAYTGMQVGREVSWLPSYGPEMRGGTANCHVMVSDSPIGSPVISSDASTLIAMNFPSMVKFVPDLIGGGLLMYNSSLISEAPDRDDVTVVGVQANEIAGEVGNLKVANMVMLGAYLAVRQLFTAEQVVAALKKVFGPTKEHFLPMNEEALRKGMDAASAKVTAKR